MKDPATLWYWNDWQGGTMTLNRQAKGCYMDLLTAQFNNGRLTETDIKNVLGQDHGIYWPLISKKFLKDESGNYYNSRLDDEIQKRKNFSQRQSENGKKGGRPVNKSQTKANYNPTLNPDESLLENENRNENRILNEKENKAKFDKIFAEMICSTSWIEGVAMQTKKSFDHVQQKLRDFLNELWLKDDYHKGIKEIKSHFINLLKKEIEKSSAKKENGKLGFTEAAEQYLRGQNNT